MVKRIAHFIVFICSVFALFYVCTFSWDSGGVATDNAYINQSEYARWRKALRTASHDDIFAGINSTIEDTGINDDVDYNSPIAAHRDDSGRSCTLYVDPAYKARSSGLLELMPVKDRRIWAEVLAAHELGHCQDKNTLKDRQINAMRMSAAFDPTVSLLLDRYELLKEERADLVALGYCKVKYPMMYKSIYAAFIKMRSLENLGRPHQTIQALQLAGPDMVVQGNIFDNADRIMAEL